MTGVHLFQVVLSLAIIAGSLGICMTAHCPVDIISMCRPHAIMFVTVLIAASIFRLNLYVFTVQIYICRLRNFVSIRPHAIGILPCGAWHTVFCPTG